MYQDFRRPFLLFTALLLAAITLAPFPAHSAGHKPRVVVLATGGTIAGSGASETTTVGYKAAVFSVEHILRSVPSLKELADVRGEQIFQIASENITPAHWLTLSRRVSALLADKEVHGVVITHGTDTMEETAYFLHLTVHSDKPVVLVGSMRPGTAISADGPINLYNAVALAASPSGTGRGVMVVMNDRISSAREVTKTNTFTADTFKSHDLGELGYLQAGKPYFYRMPVRRHTSNSIFSVDNLESLPVVEILLGYGGSGREQIDRAVAAGVKGIVFAGTGNGSLSVGALAGLSAAAAKGVAVVRASRVGSGIVTHNADIADDTLGFCTSDNLLPQKARILLMLGLTVTGVPDKLQSFFDSY